MINVFNSANPLVTSWTRQLIELPGAILNFKINLSWPSSYSNQFWSCLIPVTFQRPVAITKEAIGLAAGISQELAVFLEFTIGIKCRDDAAWLGTAKHGCSI